MYLILCFLYVCIGGKLKDLFSRSVLKDLKGFLVMLLRLPLKCVFQPLMLMLTVLNSRFDVNLKIIMIYKNIMFTHSGKLHIRSYFSA